MLAIGEIAPDFTLSTSSGSSVKLSSFKGKKPVVVFFYPADNTPGCTKEACAFEKKAPDFKAKGAHHMNIYYLFKFLKTWIPLIFNVGAEVVGISSGGAADKEKFIRANNLNSMKLLIDAGDSVRKSWGVPKALFGVLPGRVTYVIGKDGKVASIYDDLANAELHPVKALAALEEISKKK